MDYDIESKLNTVQTKPMTEAEKNTMWQKIETRMNKKTFHVFGFIRTRIRAVIAFVLVVLFAGSSVAFAYAGTAAPGDVLFPLGVAREKVEIFLAPESKKNDLRVKFAEKRIEDGQIFLTLLVKAKGTYAVSYASTTATSTNATIAPSTPTATTTAATTTPDSITEDATRRFNATIAYLEGVKTDLLNDGDTLAAEALQNAIDAMIAQARQTQTNDSSVLIKIKDNANKFKIDVRIANSTTTTKISVSEKTNNSKKGGDHGDEIVGTTTTVVKETFFSKIFHKKEEKKEEKKEKHEDHDDDEDEDEEDERGSFFDRFEKKADVCHVSDGHKKTISVGKSAVKAHLSHGDVLGKCGADGTATTTPDTTAPVISNIIASPTTTAANVAWDTNESSSYKFWYGTTSPVTLGTPDKTGGANTHQTVLLTGLSSDTTYYYMITTTDASGNTSTSSQHSFKTAVIPDTIAPTLSALSVTGITASTATVSWNTNEASTGKIRYATTSPLSNVLESTALTLSHAFNLTGLTASSTYHYVISSVDGAGNATSSAELMFTTN